MSRAYKTSQKKRTNYIYYTAEGAKIVITPGENGVTEADIQLLHEMDDAEVDEQRRYNYRVTAHLDAYHDGEGEDASDRNKYCIWQVENLALGVRTKSWTWNSQEDVHVLIRGSY
jgi:hypothetical protein